MSRNYAKAVRWYRRAAEQGYAAAQYDLAVMYASGRGVPRNSKEAGRWILRAAKGGSPKALFYLGSFSEKRKKPNLVQAYAFYSLAASALDAKVRSKAAAGMRRR